MSLKAPTCENVYRKIEALFFIIKGGRRYSEITWDNSIVILFSGT
jgi:hypothetical protein